MNEMIITTAQYIDIDGATAFIQVTIDGVDMTVPIDASNRHYDEIMRQVEAGTLTIQDAD